MRRRRARPGVRAEARGARVLRRGAALFAPLGRASRRPWRRPRARRPFPRARARLPVARRRRTLASDWRDPRRDCRNARRSGAFSTRCAKGSAGLLRLGRPVYRARENRGRKAMIDEETKDDPARPAGAPVNRDARRDPGVIEGEIAAREAERNRAAAEPDGGRERSVRTSAPPPAPLRAPALAVSWAARSPG